jgi:hypothetical protein
MEADNQGQIELISGLFGQKKSALIGVNLRLKLFAGLASWPSGA